jgi:hypothetical protein
VDTRQTGHTTTVATHAQGLVKGLHKSPELVIIAILQADFGFRPEIVIPSNRGKIEQVAGV